LRVPEELKVPASIVKRRNTNQNRKENKAQGKTKAFFCLTRSSKIQGGAGDGCSPGICRQDISSTSCLLGILNQEQNWSLGTSNSGI